MFLFGTTKLPHLSSAVYRWLGDPPFLAGLPHDASVLLWEGTKVSNHRKMVFLLRLPDLLPTLESIFSVFTF